jgi:hypothetical protein
MPQLRFSGLIGRTVPFSRYYDTLGYVEDLFLPRTVDKLFSFTSRSRIVQFFARQGFSVHSAPYNLYIVYNERSAWTENPWLAKMMES